MAGAYKRSIEHTCKCGRRATFEVFNARNASMGYFCRMCAANKIYEMNKPERIGHGS